MKFSFDIIDECPSKNDRICENWKETLAAQVWDGELVCSEERESGLRQGQGRSSATSLSLNIVIADNRLMEFWFHAIWICDILLSCHILFGARHASCRSNFFWPAPVSWPSSPCHYHLIHCGLSPSRSNFHLAQSVPDLKVINVVHSNLLPTLRWL